MTEMPRYNQVPEAFEAAPAPTAPPVMNTIFFMLLGAAVLQVMAAVLGVFEASSAAFRTRFIEQMEAQKIQNVTADMVDVAVLVSIGTIIAMAVVSVVLYVLIGLFLRKGMGWARITGAVLAVVSLSQLLGMTMPGGVAVILQVMLGIGAMVLCFTGPAAAFFTEKKNFKLANKTR